MASKEVISVLQSIASSNDGILLPADVVEAARPDDSPLHDSFTWDDGEAAIRYRLWQARTLIRTTVQYIDVRGEERPIRVFVSLTPDRCGDGGYRETVAVLSNKAYRHQLLADALEEMKRFEAKYAELTELAGVIREIRKAVS